MDIPAPVLEMLKQNAAAIQRQNAKVGQLKAMLANFLKPYGFTLAEKNGQFVVLRSDGTPADPSVLFRE